MKRALIIVFAILLLLPISACSHQEEVTYVGVNAEILEISNVVQGLVVKGLDDNSILGEVCYINCESPEVYFLYVDFDSSEVTEIQFQDLAVGDSITVDVKTVENKHALTSRVQLITQRR
ncbi:hypothetical protein [Anoxynatronum sibiricum]|uniref:DUF3221 domain-containing protein n=1 Tax=Anoxynatronum sibiricum TaxID=210623 RepID=A0ABU9VYP9_9CLOT